jgi:uncharacterized protein YbbC (DUF1343 family)
LAPQARVGLDVALRKFPARLKEKKVGVLCHSASVTSSLTHIVDALRDSGRCTVSAIFGPQHGLFGQTQDNMVEWEGATHPTLGIPVYSLYGAHRKPSLQMLAGLDALVVDLQDVGARPYTYVWTVKHCMEACAEAGIPVWVFDRPNPISGADFDGPLLSPEFFSFVGGAEIPLCHRLTMGEMAQFVKAQYVPTVDLHVVWMDGWCRDSLWNETGCPWVLPSPNMPTFETAMVYPGQVLLEATNLSEGRGTTRPFELFGAPYIQPEKFRAALKRFRVPGMVLRDHDFIPTFQKWRGEHCRGFQIHVTSPRRYRPVFTTAAIIAAAIETSGGQCAFKAPPYEYETVKIPFDILAGDARLRQRLESGRFSEETGKEWRDERADFIRTFREFTQYPEKAA